MNTKLFISHHLVFLLFAFAISSWAEEGHYYYTCSYAKPEWGTNILFSKIDLDNKAILFSKEIPLTGEICLRIPIQINHQNMNYFFLSTVFGLPGHNTPAGTPYGYYALIDDNGQVLQIDSLYNTDFLHPIDTLVNGVEYIDSTGANIIATLSINDEYDVVIKNLGENTYPDSIYPTIGGFRYFNKIDSQNDRVYWNVEKQGIYLLIIDKDKKQLIDSLNIVAQKEYFYIFGLSLDESKIYSFYIDCYCKDYLNDPGMLGKIDPSYLKRYSSADLSIVDSLDIPNPCSDSACIGENWAVCDRVDNYLVYFVTEMVHPEIFLPAKLFIFDTRTNQATWLRVGWR